MPASRVITAIWTSCVSLSNRCRLGLGHVLRAAPIKGAGASGHRRFRLVSDCAVQRKPLGSCSFACSFDHCSLVFRDIVPTADWEVRGYPARMGVRREASFLPLCS